MTFLHEFLIQSLTAVRVALALIVAFLFCVYLKIYLTKLPEPSEREPTMCQFYFTFSLWNSDPFFFTPTIATMNNDVFSSRNYWLNKLFMRQIGIWPEQSRAMRIVLPSLFLLTNVSIVIPELVRMKDVWGNIDEMIQGLPGILITVTSWIKLINGVMKREAIMELINRIEYGWKSLSNSSSSIAILQRYAAEGRNLTISYAILLYGLVTAFISLPAMPLLLDVIAPLNESRPKQFMYATEYRVDAEKYYYYILLHSYVTSYACIMIFVTIDTLFSLWVQHCCALFEIVGYNLKHSIEKLDLDPDTDLTEHPRDELAYKNLCFFIRQHKEAMIFANLIEFTFSTALAYVTGINMVIISITGVLFVIKMNDTDQAMQYAALTLGQMYHLYYNSVPGQKLIDHSNRISDCAYDNEWYTFSPRLQKSLMLVIVRAQRPSFLTAGKVYKIHMENFSVVVKTSLSYFTVLSSLR